jgi:hypothetical protein
MKEAPLPYERFLVQSREKQQAFHAVGIDFLGTFTPFKYAKKNRDPNYAFKNEPNTKRSILVFSCPLTRAVHLELCDNQKLETFSLAYERFVNTHRQPVVIYCDNQTTFLAGAKSLGGLPNEVISILTNQVEKTVEWKFNTPRAPWWGGFYERMMGIIKTHVNAVLFQHIYPTEAHLQTAVVIANRVINSRPLTPVVTDDREGLEVITPGHFLRFEQTTDVGQALDFDLDNFKPESLTIVELRRRRKNQTGLHKALWDRFVAEYLPALRKFHANRVTKDVKLDIGHYVLIQPADKMKQGRHKKMFWERGRIKSFLSSRDTRHRTAIVDRFNLDGTTTELRCPIQRLYPLEVVPEADVRRYNLLQKEEAEKAKTDKVHEKRAEKAKARQVRLVTGVQLATNPPRRTRAQRQTMRRERRQARMQG